MNISLKKLADDHINLRYILIILTRQLEKCQHARDMIKSRQFIQAALNYLCEYPQQFHHPVEEQLIQYLISRDGSILVIGDEVGIQHRELEHSTSTLRLQFTQLTAQTDSQDFNTLKDQLLELINQQHQHLESEEKYFFPLIEKLMKKQDWLDFNEHYNQAYSSCAMDEKRGEFASSILYLAKHAKSA